MSIEYGLVTHKNKDEFKQLLLQGTVLKYGRLEDRWRWDLTDSTNCAVVATNSESRVPVIGILKFDFNGRWNKMHSHGTYVTRSYRLGGVARTLWDKALTGMAVERVKVSVVSDRGLTLIESVRRNHPNVYFEVHDDGCRKLRVLRPRAA